eukprot:CAMPEP_0201551084 /NCGR_PEP_ID=MMETSP0173_2-20130828/7317_1 /ASSEMBLY_ACC=CAM_ASM_000268 /TAXON_ID=218659 /ORGANISM="Vexillifera sp., Strain DIVA3 564/2" /LENGTH=642 /DNA_ID=CAMNT_0047961245 /DNA_START=24 /DNA_END=1949 /DNA_ORIENTATION=+
MVTSSISACAALQQQLIDLHKQGAPPNATSKQLSRDTASKGARQAKSLIQTLEEFVNSGGRDAILLHRVVKKLGEHMGVFIKAALSPLMMSTIPPTREIVLETAALFRQVKQGLNEVLERTKEFIVADHEKSKSLGSQRNSHGSVIKLSRSTVVLLKSLNEAIVSKDNRPPEEVFLSKMDAAEKSVKQLENVSRSLELNAEADTIWQSAVEFFSLCKVVYRTKSESQMKSLVIQQNTLATAIKSLIVRVSNPDADPKSPRAATSSAAKEEKWRKAREMAVKEIMVTEDKYKTSLVTIFSLYMIPLKRQMGTLINREDFSLLFGNIHEFIPMHKNLHSLLDKRITAASGCLSDVVISDIFLENASEMIKYSPYINTFDKRLRLLETLQNAKDQKFNKFLQSAMAAAEMKGLDLPSFLIQPVQRLPRYELLLRELCKHTPKSHSDYTRINEAYEAVKEVNAKVNQMKRDEENREKCRSIERKLWTDQYSPASSSAAASSSNSNSSGTADIPRLDEPGRYYIREGRLSVIEVKRKNQTAKPQRSKPKSFYCFLFDDLLLVTKEKEKRKSLEPYLLRKNVSLHRILVNEATAQDMKQDFSLAIKLCEIGGLQEYILQAPTPAEKRSWLHELKSCSQILSTKNLLQN